MLRWEGLFAQVHPPAFLAGDIGERTVNMGLLLSKWWKRSKGKQGSPARLCTIYMREVASFLLRDEVANLRQVSLHTLTSITRPPRRHYAMLQIFWVRACYTQCGIA